MFNFIVKIFVKTGDKNSHTSNLNYSCDGKEDKSQEKIDFSPWLLALLQYPLGVASEKIYSVLEFFILTLLL